MSEGIDKMSLEHSPGNRSFHVHNDDPALFTITRVKAQSKTAEHYFETSPATLCFVRGTGRIALHDSLLEYGGRWFDIPAGRGYQIFPETDTVILTIWKPGRSFIDADDAQFGGIYDAHFIS